VQRHGPLGSVVRTQAGRPWQPEGPQAASLRGISRLGLGPESESDSESAQKATIRAIAGRDPHWQLPVTCQCQLAKFSVCPQLRLLVASESESAMILRAPIQSRSLTRRVENNRRPHYAGVWASLPRPEGPRQSKFGPCESAAAQRFSGGGGGACTAMMY
jgi:hypothetical protein